MISTINGRGPQRIVVLCDGTWQDRGTVTATKTSEGTYTGDKQTFYTNVALLSQCIARSSGPLDGKQSNPGCEDGVPFPYDGYQMPQTIFYQDGIGSTPDVLAKIFEGATGNTLDLKVQEAYSFVVDNFLPGDELYMFGFSRGAYTARTIAALINYVGVLTRDEQLRCYEQIWHAFRSRNPSDAKTVLHAEQVVFDTLGRWPSANAMASERGNVRGSQNVAGQQSNAEENIRALQQQGQNAVEQGNNIVPPTIQVVGVWDTVGALGVPGSYLSPKKTQFYSFFDPMLSPNVRNAFHALALFEDRKDFLPTIWTLPKTESEQAAARRKGQVLRQVWFQGSHSDVGGGHAWHGLSDVTLAWMISQLVDGEPLLNVDLGVAKRLQDARLPWARQPQHPSRPAIAFQATRDVCGWTTPRTDAVWRNTIDETATNEHIHHSVVHAKHYSYAHSECFALLRSTPDGANKLRELWDEASNESLLGKAEQELRWTEVKPADQETDTWSQRRDLELVPEAVRWCPVPLWKAIKAIGMAPLIILSTINNVKVIVTKRRKIPQANLEPPSLLLLVNRIEKTVQQPSQPLYA